MRNPGNERISESFSELANYIKYLRYFNCYSSQPLNQIICWNKCQEMKLNFYNKIKTILIAQLHFLQIRNLFKLIKGSSHTDKDFQEIESQSFLQGNQVYLRKGTDALILKFLHL